MSLGQERGIRTVRYSDWGENVAKEIRVTAFFDTDGVVVRQGLFVTPANMLIRPTN
jgi:hypothetical protein